MIKSTLLIAILSALTLTGIYLSTDAQSYGCKTAQVSARLESGEPIEIKVPVCRDKFNDWVIGK